MLVTQFYDAHFFDDLMHISRAKGLLQIIVLRHLPFGNIDKNTADL
jgi:hypothetical protein